MTDRRFAAASVGAVLLALALPGCVAAPPEASRTSTPKPTPTEISAPAPTASDDADAVRPTCDDISTPVFQSMMQSNGWQSWQTQDAEVGSRPFDIFPNGTPEGAVICRWGADPELATDNIYDLAWSEIDPATAAAAAQKLTQEGFTRTDESGAVILSAVGLPGYTDADGWGETYYFGSDHVRWAITRADVLEYTRSPS